MPYWLRNIFKIACVLAGLLAIYIVLSQVVTAARSRVQAVQTATVSSYVVDSTLSLTPFGPATNVAKPGTQMFYNMTVSKDDGTVCYINTSWRWSMNTPEGNIVYWTDTRGGETATGSKFIPKVSQAFMVPENLIPGKYTLSRLSTYKCGDDSDYVKVIRTTEILVQ